MSHIIGVKWINNNNKKTFLGKLSAGRTGPKINEKAVNVQRKTVFAQEHIKKKNYKISSLEEKFKTLKAGLILLNSVSSVLLLDILDTSIAHIPSFSHYMFGYALF